MPSGCVLEPDALAASGWPEEPDAWATSPRHRAVCRAQTPECSRLRLRQTAQILEQIIQTPDPINEVLALARQKKSNFDAPIALICACDVGTRTRLTVSRQA